MSELDEFYDWLAKLYEERQDAEIELLEQYHDRTTNWTDGRYQCSSSGAGPDSCGSQGIVGEH